MNTTRSQTLFAEAQVFIPGGVNSPVRAFKGVGGTPIFIERAQGAYIYDADGNRYVDYVGSWGPMILGHAHPAVIKAVQETAAHGLSFGAPTTAEITLASKIERLIPSIDMVRMVSSGTEATMSAIRLARGYTGHDTIIKFEGCYHGHADSLLIKAGSGALTLGVPTSPGVPASLAEHTVTLPYNDIPKLREAFRTLGETIACVIVEPVAGNMNCIPPAPGFLETLRQLCTDFGAVLIFDEVMTGFRVALGGAQQLYNITPDLTCLGKVIGGGMPVGAFGGKREIMQKLAPIGPVYQAGTLSGNPVAMAAGIATLDLISAHGFFADLTQKTQTFCASLQKLADAQSIPFTTQSVGGMFGIFFTNQKEIKTFEDVSRCDVERFKKFFHSMLDRGVYLAPSAYEAGFISSAHDDATLKLTLEAARSAFAELA